MASRGRPAKHFVTSGGETIVGLARGRDRRYRIIETGYRYTEDDERVAVKKFREWQASQLQHQAVRVTMAPHPHLPTTAITPTATIDGKVVPVEFADMWAAFDSPSLMRIQDLGTGLTRRSKVAITYPMPGSGFWLWLRELLLNHGVMVAENTGIPEMAQLASLPLPKAPITLADLCDAYKQHGGAKTKYAKGQAIKAVTRLMTKTSAVTLADLTTDRLLAFRDSIENDPSFTTGSSRKFIYSKIKTVIHFGLKRAMDAQQIRGALDRAKVLYTTADENPVAPHPISRENLHKLLAAAKGDDAQWKGMMLVALNCSLKMIDVVRLPWKHLDLVKGTYGTIREKTKRQRVPQVAVLWSETLAELKKLKAAQTHKSPYVWTSCHGTHFNRNGKGNDFSKFRERAGVKRDDGTWVCFDDFRDGAYTTACQTKGIDKALCRVMAGHHADGYEDNYVLRNPEMVKPATDAVHRFYFE